MPKGEGNLHKPISSIKGFKIRWCKKAKLSKDQKQKVKKDLYELDEKIIKVMNGTKEEDSRKEVAKIRFSLPSIPHLEAYLTVEYCNDAWHIFMETYAFYIGEILRASGIRIDTHVHRPHRTRGRNTETTLQSSISHGGANKQANSKSCRNKKKKTPIQGFTPPETLTF